MRFRVQLDAFAGPLDLLLYLVRRQELDVFDIPIATVADQYLEILAVIEELDVDAVGDFLEVATRLMEIKSRMLLPRQEEEPEAEAIADPRHDLVRRLLEYRQYKEAAGLLEERARQWQLRIPRKTNDLELGPLPPAERPIQDVELWDLVSAFTKVIRQKAPARISKIRYDDTPISVHMDRLLARLAQTDRLRFADLFEPDMHRSKLVGMFLAILELVRHGRIRAEQDELFADIWVSAAPPNMAELPGVVPFTAEPPGEAPSSRSA